MQNHNKSILSIIIPHYNNFSIINECINSLNKVNFENYEIIVIDNNSQDESVRLIKKNHTNVKIIQSDSNVKSLLINIFGGIIRCDMIASGIVEAIEEIDFK